MPISLKCPHCKKPLKVKDHLAGKKATCPACKRPLVIPMPVDVEALAAEALADALPPKEVVQEQQPAKAAKTIDYTCPYCDAELHLPGELGGKKAPCPECRNIIKVPVLVEERPKDWRTAQARVGPSAALINTQKPQIEGVWDTTQKARVSTESLEEAGAIEEDVEPVGVGGWIKRVVVIGGVAGAIVLTVWLVMRGQAAKTQNDAIAQALAFAENKAADKVELSPPWRAEIYRAAGEFHARKKQPTMALREFNKARAQFPRNQEKNAPSLDQDVMLSRLALSVVDLGGDAKEVADEERLEWKDVQLELGRTLGAIGSIDVKAAAAREVVAKLLQRKQGLMAVGLLMPLSQDEGSPVKAQLLGLLHDANVPLEEKKRKDMLDELQVPRPDPVKGVYDKVARLGYAEARAREGKYDDALKIADAVGPNVDRLQAALIVAAVARAAENSGESKRSLDKAFELVLKLKDGAPPWLRLQLVTAAVQANEPDKADAVIKSLPPEFKNWALLEAFQAELARTQAPMEITKIDENGTGKDSLPRALAWEALARHNTSRGDRAWVRHAIDTVDDPRVRPFLFAGLALGSVP